MNDADFGLVLPFVVCQSQGGPFEDGAFTAGFECGGLDARLARREEPRVEVTVHSSSLAQLDLIAMRHGYTTEAHPWVDHPDQWAFAVFTLVTP